MYYSYRCGGKYDTNLVANLLLSPTVKEFLKSANISQSYERISSGTFLWATVCVVLIYSFYRKTMHVCFSALYTAHCTVNRLRHT